MDAVAEEIVTEQLLNTMPNDLRIWIGERKPKTYHEAGRLADDYALARKSSHMDFPTATPGGKRQGKPSSRECLACGQLGHWARNYPKRTTREQTKDPEPEQVSQPESTQDQRQKEKNGQTGPEQRKCYNCKERGHLAAHCPNVFLCSLVPAGHKHSGDLESGGQVRGGLGNGGQVRGGLGNGGQGCGGLGSVGEVYGGLGSGGQVCGGLGSSGQVCGGLGSGGEVHGGLGSGGGLDERNRGISIS